ncbi:MAG: winged helix-turn-helix domain-containing protein [Candidatus Solibacter sp.]
MIRTWRNPPLEAGKPPIRFGVFEVDFASGELRKQGVKIKLQEQPFRALVAFVEHPSEVLTREELQKRLWPADTVVDFERGINKAINRLREALGDDADNPRFIETIPQRGYRFLAQVETAEVLRPSSALVPEIPPGPPGVPLMRRRGFLAAAGVTLGVAISAFAYRMQQTPSPRIESIAVLPLENLSGNPAQEFFSDGLTDELIGEVARIRSLRVISRTSIMQYKGGARKSVQAIARELNVDAILEGTVVQSGQRVRITAQLIRARDDRHIMSEEYERDLTDIIALQGDVARAIAGKIKIELTSVEQRSLTRTRRVNPEAYEAYLQGNFFLHQGIQGIAKSMDFFRQAIRMDASQPEAHAGLAEALCYAGIFGFRPSAETYQEARLAAQNALELDEGNAVAHNALADVKQGYDWDLAGAEKEFQRALQLNPSHLLTHLWYGECLTRMERYDDALAESGRALALDPVSPGANGNRAMLLWRARRYQESIEASKRALDVDTHFINALVWQGLSHAGKRDFPKAFASLTQAANMNNGPTFRALLGHVHGLAGDKGKALGILNEIATIAKQRFVSPVDFAVVYAGVGDADSTFLWLEKAYQVRAVGIQQLHSPYFDGFRSDPRYENLTRRVGLPSQTGRVP